MNFTTLYCLNLHCNKQLKCLYKLILYYANFNCSQEFDLQSLTLTMDDSKRPGDILLLKSNDGVSYQPWVYRVTSEDSCKAIFKMPILYTPESLDSVVCLGFGKAAAPRYEEVGPYLYLNVLSTAIFYF